MDYKKVYDSIINRAKERELIGYKESHHIIPKCLGGSNKKENLVNLTAREHYLVHWLLHRIYPSNNGLAYAFYTMVNTSKTYKRSYKVSNRVFEEAKIAFAEAHSKKMIGTRQSLEHTEKIQSHRRGKKTVHNPETNEQLYINPLELDSYLEKGWVNSHKSKGVKRSDATKAIISENTRKRQLGKVGLNANASKGIVVLEYEDGTKVEAGSVVQLSNLVDIPQSTLGHRILHNPNKFVKGSKIYYK